MDIAVAPRLRPAADCRALAPARAWLRDAPARAAVLGTLTRPSAGPHGAPPGCGRTHLPAMAAALLIRVRAGTVQRPDAPGQGEPALGPGLYLSGPRERPHTLVHAPEAELTLVALRPQAWRARMHTDWTALKERLVPAQEWCPLAYGPQAQDLQACLAGEDPVQALEAMLRASSKAMPAAPDGEGLRGLWQGLGSDLAQRPVGERQRQRLARAWTGLTPRMLRSQARAEAALVHGAALLQRGQLDWRQVALLAGYSDQSHLCRETRRLTGFSPVQLMQGMLGDEAFWVYRAWALARLGGPMLGTSTGMENCWK